MFLSAHTVDDLIAIRDWLRFLVVRQRIPHLVLGLEFEWAKEEKERKRKMKLIREHIKRIFLRKFISE